MKKRILATLALIMMLNNPKALSEEPLTPQGHYSNGNIYFGSEEYIENIEEKVGPFDVLIVDERDFKKNPSVKILDSYKIDDSSQRLEIIEFLDQYEKDNPSDWERSVISMVREWAFHNFLYSIRVERSHTKDVDLDNKDENYYVRKRKK